MVSRVVLYKAEYREVATRQVGAGGGVGGVGGCGHADAAATSAAARTGAARHRHAAAARHQAGVTLLTTLTLPLHTHRRRPPPDKQPHHIYSFIIYANFANMLISSFFSRTVMGPPSNWENWFKTIPDSDTESEEE